MILLSYVESTPCSNLNLAAFILDTASKLIFERLPLRHLGRDEKWFILIAALHFVFWTAAPSLGFSSPPLDVIENRFWGNEWLIGTYKHPPLQAWATQISWQFGGVSAIYAMSQICVIATAAALFLLGRDISNPQTGLLAAGIYFFCYYATIPTPEFNANIVSAPFWAFAGYFLWRLINQGGTAELGFWLGLSLSVALAFYAKYSVLFLVIGLLLATLTQPKGRALFKSFKIYAAAILTMALCMPNIIWLFTNDLQPLIYAASRAKPLVGLSHLTSPLNFVINVGLAFVLPTLLLLLAGAKFANNNIDQHKSRFINCLAFIPLLAMIFMSVVSGTGLKSMWGATAAVWVALFIAIHSSSIWQMPHLSRALPLAAFVFFLMPVAVGSYSIYSAGTAWPQRTAWPGTKITSTVLNSWKTHRGDVPKIIIGPTFEAGLIAHFLPHNASVLTDGSFAKSPWITPKMINDNGALLVWTSADVLHPSPYKVAGIEMTPFEAEGKTPIFHKGKSRFFHWAILAPKRK